MRLGAKTQADQHGIETPHELGARYLRELRELVDQGEISPLFAQRIIDDLFTPGEPGQPPRLRWSVWSAYIAELTGDHSTAPPASG